MTSRKRYTRHTVAHVRVAVDADRNVGVLNERGEWIMTLGKAVPHPTTSRRWLAVPDPELGVMTDHETMRDAIAELVRRSGWSYGLL